MESVYLKNSQLGLTHFFSPSHAANSRVKVCNGHKVFVYQESSPGAAEMRKWLFEAAEPKESDLYKEVKFVTQGCTVYSIFFHHNNSPHCNDFTIISYKE